MEHEEPTAVIEDDGSPKKRIYKPAKRKKRKLKRAKSPARSARFKELHKPGTPFRIKYEAMQAARRADPLKLWSRRGVPDGMKRAEAFALTAKSAELAKKDVATMVDKQVIEDPSVSEDAKMATEALTTSLTIMRGPQNERLRLAAAGQVLKYTKAPPSTSQKITLQGTEDWLAAVMADANPKQD